MLDIALEGEKLFEIVDELFQGDWYNYLLLLLNPLFNLNLYFDLLV